MAGWKQKLAETARKNRVELIDAKLSRRDLFKLGLLTSSGFLVTKLGLSSRAAGAEGTLTSPPTTPWIEPLPIPPVARPLTVDQIGTVPTEYCNLAAGEMGRPNPHAFWEYYDPANMDFYVNENRVTMANWHRELPLDTCWCFNGMFPGPRIHAHVDRPVMIRFKNMLPSLAVHKGYGRPTPTTHLHNGHTESDSDGNPLDMINPGTWKDHFYLNKRAGFTDPKFGELGDIRETMSTLWYHDHCLDYTSQNVYRGNMGLYYIFNEFDTGNENDTSRTAWRLPSGDFDIPLVFHDRVFDPSGYGYFDLFNLDGIIGDKFTVNGKIQPFLRVARRKYRFRAQNIGTSRFYNFFLSNGQTMVQCSHDGNMLPRPLTVKNFRIAVAQRVDVIIDFSKLPDGTELYLVNCQEQTDGRGPTGKILPVQLGTKILKFIVDNRLPKTDNSRIPLKFFDLPPVNLKEAVTERTFVFDRTNGGWSVNGKQFDENVITASPRQGTAEVWNIVNNSGGWMHPVHIHFEEHQQLSINGAPPPIDEISREDVIWLGHGETHKIFRRFRDFLGRYPTHCHNVVHEDHAMMFMWKIVP
ncbi:MAG TPA: multicopper oxidase domain-containing protein [Candidatus Eisenbacteria bacterium]|jgi:FtsP/CotA-like multicopper oxidase with cupredoxin domain